MLKKVSIKTINNKNKTRKTLLNVFMLTFIMFVISMSTVYALSYTVSYNNNGGSGTMSDSIFTSNPGTLSTNTFTKTGYKFMGWNKNSSATSDWYRQNNSFTGTDGSSTTLYAQWCKVSNGTIKISNNEVKDTYGNYVFRNNKYITVKADNKTITYGGTPSYSYTVTGTLNGESGVTGTASYTVKDGSNNTIAPSSAAVGSYTISVSGLSAATGYTIQNTNTGTLTINAQKCNAPTNVSVSTAGRVTWTASTTSACTKYRISANDSTFTNDVSSGHNYLSTINAATGTRKVYVRAYSDDDNYSESASAIANVTVYAITFASNDTNKGTVSPTSYNVISGATVATSGNNLLVKGVTSGTSTTTLATVTPTAKTGYAFASWSKTSGSLTSAQTITGTFLTKVTTDPSNALCKCTGISTCGTSYSSFAYNGSSQQLTTATSGTGYSLSGYNQTNVSATGYEITGTLTSGYSWSDGTTGTKKFTCYIPKATPTITLSAESGSTIIGSNLTFSEKANVAGKFKNSSSDTAKATVSPAESSSAVSANTNATVTVTPVAAGSSTITVIFTPTDTTNYNTITTTSNGGKTYAATIIPTATIPTNSLCKCTGISTCSSSYSSFAYNGSQQQLTTATSGTGYSLSGHNQTNVNTNGYTITATLADGYSWSDGTTETKTFTCYLPKRTVTVTAPTAVSSVLTYSGSGQNLLSSVGSCSAGGEMYYWNSNPSKTQTTTPNFSTSTFTNTAPTTSSYKGTDAGTYYMYYYCRVTDTDNNTGSNINSVKSVTKEIEKRTDEITITKQTTTYDGLTHSTVASASSGQTPEITYYTDSNCTKKATEKYSPQLGDYVLVVPDLATYSIPVSLTGRQGTAQIIHPSELVLWRVIDIHDDGTIDAVSEYVSSDSIGFFGKTGYANYINAMQTISTAYAATDYTVGTRMMGYDGQTLTIADSTPFGYPTTTPPDTTSTPSPTTGTGEEYSGGTLGDTLYLKDYLLVQNVYKKDNNTSNYTSYGVAAYKVGTQNRTGYWIASRRYIYSTDSNYGFEGRAIYYTGIITSNHISYYSGGWLNGVYLYNIRPIITIKANLRVSGGEGSKNNPYSLTNTTTNLTDAMTYYATATTQGNSNYNEGNKTCTEALVINPIPCNPPTNVAVSTAGRVTWTNSTSSTCPAHQIKIANGNYQYATSGVDKNTDITSETGSRNVSVIAKGKNSNYGDSAAAIATPDVYQVTFSSNNTSYGTVSPTSKNVIGGATVELSSNKLLIKGITTGTTTTTLTTVTPTAKTDYVFKNWSKTSGSITSTQNITGEFVYNSFTVTADATGGTIPTTEGWTNSSDNTTATATVQYKKKYGELPTPTRTNYRFDGWYTEETGGSEITSSTTVNIIDDHTIYAHWTETYTITYNAGSGTSVTGLPEAQTKIKGTNIKLQTGIPTSSGKAFIGWANVTNATASTGTWYDEGQTYTTDANLTLYAQWYDVDALEKAYTTYVQSGDFNIKSGGTKKDISPSNAGAISASAPTNSGYTFKTVNAYASSNLDMVRFYKVSSGSSSHRNMNPSSGVSTGSYIDFLYTYNRTATTYSDDINTRIERLKKIQAAAIKYSEIKVVSKAVDNISSFSSGSLTHKITHEADNNYIMIAPAGFNLANASSSGTLVSRTSISKLLKFETFAYNEWHVFKGVQSASPKVKATVYGLEHASKTSDSVNFNPTSNKGLARYNALVALNNDKGNYFPASYIKVSGQIKGSTVTTTAWGSGTASKSLSIPNGKILGIVYHGVTNGTNGSGESFASIAKVYISGVNTTSGTFNMTFYGGNKNYSTTTGNALTKVYGWGYALYLSSGSMTIS